MSERFYCKACNHHFWAKEDPTVPYIICTYCKRPLEKEPKTECAT